MKLIFGKDFIEIKNDNETIHNYTLKNLKEDTENNIIFKLLELCVRSEEIEFTRADDSTPYLVKLYDILCDEFEMKDIDI